MADNCRVFFKQSRILPFVEMRQADASSACYSKHSHDEFSFGVIDAGVGNYWNTRTEQLISQDTVVTINPGDLHSCNPETNAWSYRMLFIDTDWVSSLQQEIISTSVDYIPFASASVHSAAESRVVSQLFETLREDSDILLAESLLVEFFESAFYQSLPRLKKEPAESVRVSRIHEMIMDQLDENLTLDDFSETSQLSRSHLIRSFKQVYGQSPHAYQLDQRIKKAKRLLREGQSLSETAQQLGFADQSHFQRNFKKRLAVTPKQYQTFFS